MPSSPASFRLSAAVAIAFVALPFASHPRGQAPATPIAAFSITKIPSVVRQVIPGDFTGDGRIDLIASTAVAGRTPGLIFLRGRGDGTFEPAQSRGAAEPLAAGDVNGDGRLDVVVRIGESVSVLPGNGNGTFSTPHHGILPDDVCRCPTQSERDQGRRPVTTDATLGRP
jgi:hypothetical protein